MCGITGFISTSGEVKEKDFRSVLSLLVANEERGTDSSGLAFLGDCVRIRKSPVPAYRLVKRVKYMSELSALFGHTRQATTGAVTKRNAHPFRCGRITGIHNGIVDNYLSVKTKFNVDSEAIFYLLDKYNNDFIKSFKELSGSFAIAWFDEKEKDSLYLAKCGNPLYIARTDTGYYFSSLEQSLKTVLLRDIKEWIDIEDDDAIKISTKGKIEKFKVDFKNDNRGYGRYYGDYYGSYYDENPSYFDNKVEAEHIEEDLMDLGYHRTFMHECSYCHSRKDTYYEQESGDCCCLDCARTYGYGLPLDK